VVSKEKKGGDGRNKSLIAKTQPFLLDPVRMKKNQGKREEDLQEGVHPPNRRTE